MEIWGGNQAADTAVAVPGLDVWVYSRPFEGASGGGDIYYVSQCISGNIARIALADVSGHGEPVDELARELRSLMRRNINTPDQTRFARRLNRAFSRVASEGRFATALLATYFAPQNRLIVVNAGHPRPLRYTAATGLWSVLDTAASDPEAGGLPLGIIDRTEYAQFAVTLSKGDVIVLYTDSMTEAMRGGKLLGEEGLLELARGVDAGVPQDVVSRLVESVRTWRGGGEFDDDATMIVLHHNAAKPPPQSLGDRLAALTRLIGL